MATRRDFLVGAAGATAGLFTSGVFSGAAARQGALIAFVTIASGAVLNISGAEEKRIRERDGGRLINFGGEGAVERLVTPGTQGALEVIHSVIEPGGNGGEELYALACDAECAYVLSGRVEVVLEHGSETLDAGDAMTFPGSSPHTWRNPGDEPCEVLWIMAPAP